MSGRDPGSLRVEVVVPDAAQAWMVRLCERLAEIDGVDVGIRISHATQRLETESRTAVTTLRRVDAALYGRRRDRAERLVPAPVDRPIEHPDIVLDLGGGNPADGSDVWTVSVGDGLTEVIHGEPATPVVVRSSQRGILAASWVPTHPRSGVRTRSHVCWTAVELTVATMEKVARAVEPAPVPDVVSSIDEPPSMASAGRYLGRSVRTELTEQLRQPDWGIWYRVGGSTDPADTAGLRRLRPTEGEYWADPFVLAADAGAWVYFEAFSHSTSKGRIDAVRLTPGGLVEGPVRILDQPIHLSYPMIFPWRDELWMAPESAASGGTQLFRIRGLPDELEPEGSLVDEPVLDPTLHEDEDGTWWLFGTKTAEYAHHGSDLLYVWWAPSPLGPWEPHPQNPVVTDTRKARPAGALYQQGSRLIRPAQDCSGAYGRAVVLCEVERLNRYEYQERVVGRIDPTWDPGLSGTHTVNRDGDVTVLDGLSWRSRFL